MLLLREEKKRKFQCCQPAIKVACHKCLPSLLSMSVLDDCALVPLFDKSPYVHKEAVVI